MPDPSDPAASELATGQARVHLRRERAQARAAGRVLAGHGVRSALRCAAVGSALAGSGGEGGGAGWAAR